MGTLLGRTWVELFTELTSYRPGKTSDLSCTLNLQVSKCMMDYDFCQFLSSRPRLELEVLQNKIVSSSYLSHGLN